MKRLRTRRFRLTLGIVSGLSALFLGWIALFGRNIAQTHFRGIADAVFAVLALAAGSFVAFCFLPYFHGDRRWYSIPALLTVVFLAGVAILWQVPGVVVAL